MKKILSVVLSLAMLLSLLAVPAMAEDTINIIWYNTEDTYKNNVAANPDAFDPVWSVIPEFEAATGVKVNVIAVEWGDMINTAATRVGNGEPLDLVQANDQSFPVYPARKIVQPIAQYLDLSKDCFYDSVTNAFTFGGQAYAAGNDVPRWLCITTWICSKPTVLICPVICMKPANGPGKTSAAWPRN